MSEFDDLYQAIILDHYRKPRNRGTVADANLCVDGKNPLCGDEVHLELRVDGDGRIADIKSSGHGCSISQASISIMTELLKGRTFDEGRQLLESVRAMMKGGAVDEEEMGELVALKGVSRFPVRIKCAMLSWTTFELAMAEFQAGRDGAGAVVSTEDEK